MSEYNESEHYPHPADDERERLQRVWDEDAIRCAACRTLRAPEDLLISEGEHTCRACLFGWLRDILRGSDVSEDGPCVKLEDTKAQVKRAFYLAQSIVAFDPDAAFGEPVKWRNPRPE